MSYCVKTPNKGITTLNPIGEWDGMKGYKFKMQGRRNFSYTTDPESRQNILGMRVSVTVTSSVTEAEAGAAATCAQDMIYTKNIIESLDLEMEFLIMLEIDNRGAVDLINSWSVRGSTRHKCWGQTELFARIERAGDHGFPVGIWR